MKAAVAGLQQGGGKTVVFWDDPHAPRSDGVPAVARAVDRRARRPVPRGRGRRREPARHGRHRARDARGSRVSIPRAAVRATRRRSPRSACCTACAPRARPRSGRATCGPARRRAGRGPRRRAPRAAARRRRRARRDRRRRRGEGARRPACRCSRRTTSLDRRVRRARAVRARRRAHRRVGRATLRCAVVCGAANNQLARRRRGRRARRARDRVRARLRRERGRHHQHRAGVGARRLLASTRAYAEAARIEDTTRHVLARARAEGITTAHAADELGRRRIAAEGGPPYRPGDPSVMRDALARPPPANLRASSALTRTRRRFGA